MVAASDSARTARFVSYQWTRNLGLFSRIAILGIIQLGTEFWAIEIIALVAGRLGRLPLATQSVLMTADQILVTIPFGIGVATSVRTGSALGSQDHHAAKRVSRVAVTLSIVVATMVLVMLVISRQQFAKLFTTDQDVVEHVAEVLPWVALFQIADGVNGSCGGAVRGMGKQHIGAAANIISYYVIALPLGSWMAFEGFGLSGLSIGQCIGMSLVASAELLYVLTTDWRSEISLAMDRIREEEAVIYERVGEV
ncbi:multidrug and toxin extrusion protein [Verticillium dahliae VdLs.17]|uniref:Multidrug and toxin extrusion protein n=1 Tax=Verticillium dahliae (strain VdLs.17 / ATCC MYA-4575 / FGSC 10137) TaxID=498257 RepID=G2X395_VERDV|nr:multidrug and toxin extrusion protein [Verticillium dahliae VdLs.17]EGY23442.1 multidrug and toxin extrusion protein [Verticillium dahliae VdLs.17]